MAAAVITKALRYLLLDPIAQRSLPLLLLRLSQLASERAGGRLDAPLVRLLAMAKPPVPLPPSRRMDDAAIADTVGTLRRRGWEILPWRLSDETIGALRRFAFSTPAWARDPRQRIAIAESDPPREEPRYQWLISDLAQVPAVQDLIADSALHKLAQAYLGARPLLTSMVLMLDPAYRGVFDAHVYHFDLDGPKFLKFFIYLTDVDATSGAHAYIAGSHGHRKPPALRLATRYDRGLLLDHYGADSEKLFEAPAGTILAEDTAGFHRGSTPLAGFRLLLQFEFGLIDIPNVEESLAAGGRASIGGLDPAIGRIVRKFFV